MHPEDITGRTGQGYPKIYPGSEREEQIQTRKRGVERTSGNSGRRQWLTGVQDWVRTNPAPLFLIGSGVAIGALAAARSRQRKKVRRSILMRDFSGIAETIRTSR